MSTDKTLADVQPGGRVRLGNVRDHVMGECEQWFDTSDVDMEAATDSIIAAAQPSPGGQGDALDLDRLLSLADVHAEESREDGLRLLDRGGLLAFAQDVAAALAARQPVRSSTVSEDMMDVVDRLGSEHDEVDPRAWDHMLIYAPTEKLAARLTARQPVDEVSVKKEDANNYCLILRALGMEEEGDPVAEVQALIEARDRQPVGEPVAWYYGFSDTGEAGPVTFGGTPGAEAIAWAERHGHTLHYLYAAPPAQAVDLANVIDQIAQQWDGCSYDAVGETIDVGQAIRAAGKRLALIDSQAVRS